MKFLLLPAFSIIFLSGCLTRTIATKSMNQEAFPKDLDQPGYTLLVMKMEYSGDDKRYKKSYEKAAVQTDEFVKTLKFPAIAVTKQELASGKYDDANKYRYLLQPYDEKKETTVFRSTKPQGGGMHT